MSDLEPEPDERAEPVDESASWTDAQYWRSVALLKHDAEIEDDDGDARSPNYDW